MPDGAVGWVLTFLQTDLEGLTPTEWTLVALKWRPLSMRTGTDSAGWWHRKVAERKGYPTPRTIRRFPVAKKRRTFRPESWSVGTLLARRIHAFTFPQMTLAVVSRAGLRRGRDHLRERETQGEEFEYRFLQTFGPVRGLHSALPGMRQDLFSDQTRPAIYCQPAAKPRRGEKVARKPKSRSKETTEDRRGKKRERIEASPSAKAERAGGSVSEEGARPGTSATQSQARTLLWKLKADAREGKTLSQNKRRPNQSCSKITS